MSPFGDQPLDLPFEKIPPGSVTRPLGEMLVCGGVTVSGAVVPVPGLGPMPALIFTFVQAGGTPMPAIALVNDADHIAHMGSLVESAATAAIEATS